jgi:hypothetical protein
MIAFSCSSGDSWLSGCGWSDCGAVEASGGTDILEASGADVCDMMEACGLHLTATKELAADQVPLKLISTNLEHSPFPSLSSAHNCPPHLDPSSH